jgi:hypothetical protein
VVDGEHAAEPAGQPLRLEDQGSRTNGEALAPAALENGS